MAQAVLVVAAYSGAAAAGWGTLATFAAVTAASYVGGMIDNWLFGSSVNMTTAGPRLSDTRVQTSVYGKSIPKVYGRARFAGNIIWARDLKEVETRTTQSSGGGGKGGGGGGATQTTISYNYYATLAIAICEGPIDSVVRVWADSKLLTSDYISTASGNYNIYVGNETQNPDPIMVSFEGSGNVPGHRGLAYVTLRDFPLADYGNRIPNFTFEVKRTVTLPGAVEEKVTELIIIPGSGEYVYATVKTDKQEINLGTGGEEIPTGEKFSVNIHNVEGRADVFLAIEDMLEVFPNLEWVGVVLNWFVTDTDLATASVVPKVEFHSSTARIEPASETWSSGGYTRATAQTILYFDPEETHPTYGGTPSDKSVLDFFQYLASVTNQNGSPLSIMCYPMPLVDVITPDPKPWRGRLVPTSAAEVANFFTKSGGYNEFIRHYATLNDGSRDIRNYIDAYVIGSELVGITSYDSGGHTYPGVTQLKNLAALVKGTDFAAHSSIKVIYAADWSEYHSVGGYYNLDPLWTDSNIDIVGIDAYFPLTPDLPQNQISYEDVYNGWTQDEGYDYYYTDPNARTGLTSYGGDPTFAWKNVEHWWNSTHYNPGPSATGWTPKMKPIWFTEFGFPSLDGASNQPNVFVDPDSSESAYPRGSRRRVDFFAQRQAVEASIDFLDDQRAVAGNSNLVAKKFLWTWDARPFPEWPDLTSIWADGRNWKYGHWLNGKFGLSSLAAIVAELLGKVDYESSDYDVSDLASISVDGYMILNPISVRQALTQLQTAFFYDMTESNGQLRFVRRGKSSVITIDATEVVVNQGEQASKETVTSTRKQELELPRVVTFEYINRVANYDPNVQMAQRQTVNSVDVINLQVPIVLTDQEGKTIADVSLYTAWQTRTTFMLRLPRDYIALEPTDIITLVMNGVSHVLRIVESEFSRGIVQIRAVTEDVSSYDFYIEPGLPNITPPLPKELGETVIELLDLPALPQNTDNNGIMYAVAVGTNQPWPGAVLYRSLDGGEDEGNTFNPYLNMAVSGAIGQVLNDISDGPVDTWDNGTTIEVALRGTSVTLESVTELAVLNGANACVIGDEIIQFQNATLTAPNKYTLSKLLRGRRGTENEVSNHAVGDRFVLLNTAVEPGNVSFDAFNSELHYKAVTVGKTLAGTDEFTFTYTGKVLKPYSPVQISASADGLGNITITWVRRARIHGNWQDNIDVPLDEATEAYEIDILDGSTVVRTFAVTTPLAIYTAVEQGIDFGSTQSTISVRVYQMSAVVGRGFPGIATLNV